MIKKSFKYGKQVNYNKRKFSTFSEDPNKNRKPNYLIVALFCGLFYNFIKPPPSIA